MTAACLIAISTAARGQVYQTADLQISVLEDGLWVVETSDNTTMYIVEGDEKAMLIDTGTDCEKLDEVVRKITQKPLYVVITHVHPDHAGNMDFFDEVYLHAADTVLLGWGIRPYEGKIHYVEDGDIFDLGGKQIRVAHMPGHTPGSIVLLDEAAGNCYSGDAFGSGQVWLQLRPFTPMKTYVRSCRKMEKLIDEGITKIYCGHYPYVKQAFGREYMVQMRRLAEKIVNGTAPEAEPHPVKLDIGAENPVIVTEGQVAIVYDPDHF